MKNKESSLISCFFIFSIFLVLPFLEFISYNQNTIKQNNEELIINFLTIKRLFIIYLFFLIIFFISLIFLKFKKKNLFSSSLFIVASYYLLFNYNYFKKIILNLFFQFNINILKYDGYLALTFIIIFVLIIYYFLKKKNEFIKKFLLIFFSISIIFECYEILKPTKIELFTNNDYPNTQKIILDGNKRSNIYYFILDAMPSIKDFDKLFNENSSDFINELKKIGFLENKNSIGDYGNTYFTIGSIFHLDNFDKLLEEDRKISYKLLYPSILRKNNQSNLEYNLKNINYDIYWIGSYFSNCQSFNKEYCIKELDEKSNLFFNYENKSFMNKTPFFPILSKIFNFFGLNIEKKLIFKSNDALGKFLDFAMSHELKKNNQFYLIHDLKTHWPYLTDSNCNYEENLGKKNIQGIKNVVNCSRSQLIKIAKLISNKDPDAIVIFQSDHNWELANYDQMKFGNRREFFNVIKLNSYCTNKISKFNSHTNTIKFALKCATESTLDF